MEKDSLRILYKNFIPKTKEKIEIIHFMRELEWEAPSDSSIHLNIKRTWGKYKLECRLYSTALSFKIILKAENLAHLLESLNHEFRSKLISWKSERNFSAMVSQQDGFVAS